MKRCPYAGHPIVQICSASEGNEVKIDPQKAQTLCLKAFRTCLAYQKAQAKEN